MTEVEREAILSEIDEFAGVPEKQPGDVGVQELKERWGVTPSAVGNRMRRLIDRGLYTTHLVYDQERQRRCRVYRRVKTDA